MDDFSNPRLTQKELFVKEDSDDDEDDDIFRIWEDQDPLTRDLKKPQKKKLYEYFWFDVPHIWNRSTYGYQFMQALQIN